MLMLDVMLGMVLVAGPQDTLVLRIEDAVTRGLRVSPVVSAAVGAVAAPLGQRAESRLPLIGPVQLEGNRVRRNVSGQSGTWDWGLAVRQGLDISGGSFVRARAAESRVDAARFRIEDARRRVTLEVQLAYLRVVLADRRRRMLDSSATLGERLSEITRRRLDAGELTRLDANAALIDASRQRSAAGRASASSIEAGSAFGRLLALPTDTVGRGAELPDLPPPITASSAELLAVALPRRPDLLAAELELTAASRDLTVARRAQIPTLEVGWSWGREGTDANLGGLTLGLMLPVFQRFQGARGEAVAAEAARQADQLSNERQVSEEIHAAAARYTRAREAAARFDAEILLAAEDNVRLSERALEEGELGIRDVIVLRSLALAARLEHLEVLQETFQAWYSLAAALAVSTDELLTLSRGLR